MKVKLTALDPTGVAIDELKLNSKYVRISIVANDEFLGFLRITTDIDGDNLKLELYDNKLK